MLYSIQPYSKKADSDTVRGNFFCYICGCTDLVQFDQVSLSFLIQICFMTFFEVIKLRLFFEYSKYITLCPHLKQCLNFKPRDKQIDATFTQKAIKFSGISYMFLLIGSSKNLIVLEYTS